MASGDGGGDEGGGFDGGGFEGGGFDGGGFDGGGFELPEGAAGEVPDGGSLLLLLGPVELPPQPASASATIASGTSNVVVAFPFFIVLTPVCPRFVAVTDRDKHQLFPKTDSMRYTSTRSMPPAFARATYSAIQFSPSTWRAISTTM